MNSPYEKRSSLEELMSMNEPQPPTVQISEEEWTRLGAMLERMETLVEQEETARTTMTKAGEEYLKAMKQAATEQTKTAKEAIQEIAQDAKQQVGSASEKASHAIERRTMRDEFLWWFRLLCMALPTILVLLLAAYMGWLPLFR